MAKKISAQPYRIWHRLFGLLLVDHLQGSPFVVELEKDLSRRRQLLDVVVVRRCPGVMHLPLPDGFEALADHNLISFKSFQEPFDDWTLKELTGHYVNYRKQVSLPREALLPETDFKLYAVCARRPRELFRLLDPQRIQDGVYDLKRGSDVVRLIVAGELLRKEANALLHLFSASPETIKYGAAHHKLRSQETSTVVNELYENYSLEGLIMSYTIEDFRRERFLRTVREMTAEQRLEGLTLEERLAGLSEKDLEAYLQRLRTGTPQPKAKKKPKR